MAEALDIRGLLDFLETPGLGYYEFDNLHTISAQPPTFTVAATVAQPISSAVYSDNSAAAASAAAAAAAAAASAAVAVAAKEREAAPTEVTLSSVLVAHPAEPMPAPEARPNPMFSAPGDSATSEPAAAYGYTPPTNSGVIYGSMDLRGYGSVAEAVRVNLNQAEASTAAAVDDAEDAAKLVVEKAETVAEAVAAEAQTGGERVVVGGTESVKAAEESLGQALAGLNDAADRPRSAAADVAAARASVGAAATASACAVIAPKSDDVGPYEGSGSLAELFRKL